MLTLQPDSSLKGKVALVTGAGRRVGRAIALALGEAGAQVAVHYNGSEKGANETARQIRDGGSKAEIFQADLLDPSAPEQLIKSVTEKLGGIDILINSAAVMERTPLSDVSIKKWDDTLNLNLRAPFFLALEFAKTKSASVVVNIADLAAFEVWPDYIPHSIAKAGVVQMTRALAKTLAPKVRVNAVAPGAVLLPEDWPAESAARLERSTPLKRLGNPGDVAGAVLYLVTAQYVTGETIIVDGGRHVR